MPANLRRPRRAVLAALAAMAAGVGMAATAAAQQRDESAMWSWLDRYYADYTAMSRAPTGPAMDAWLAHYAPDALFEDPTLGVSATGRDQIRKPYVEAFTGRLGPVHWTIVRRLTGPEWAAVEGWLEGTHSGKPLRTRFTTWLKVRDGKIVHQIDYLDYAPFRRR